VRASVVLRSLSAALVTFYDRMWIYLAVALGVLIAFNVLIVVVVSVAAGHTEPRDELRVKERERILTFVR
jgi:hypothetical protein